MGLQRVRLNNTHLNITMFSQCNGSVNIIVKIRNKHPQCPGFPGGSAGEESTCHVGDLGLIPGLGRDPLEKGKDTHSSILAWRIPWPVESMGGQELDTTEQLSVH